MPNPEETRKEQLEKACIHMEHVRKGLVVILGADDAISTLGGALVNTLVDTKGVTGAEAYLRELADEVVRDAGPPPTLH